MSEKRWWAAERKSVGFLLERRGGWVTVFVTKGELGRIAGVRVEDADEALREFDRHEETLRNRAREVVEGRQIRPPSTVFLG